MFNTLKKPFDDKRVRQAFYYAVDVDKLISNAMAGHAAKVTELPAEEPRELPQGFHGVHLRPREGQEPAFRAGVTDLSFELMTNTTG